ncbi:hypothetical protein BRD56_05125 [Thermoplasmatales archaeon SW_10_69_26]|nr:MAG: hypothetical protein BRD56_05125 [Thermoplasmatales archaeon SW_10_69_26]
MPHVIVDEEPDLRAVLEAFEPDVHQEEGRVARTKEAFVSADETELVITGLAIDQGDKANVLLRVTRREGDGVVRLDEQFRPEVTEPVKRLVARIADLVLEVTGAGIERTNVQAQLDAVRA